MVKIEHRDMIDAAISASECYLVVTDGLGFLLNATAICRSTRFDPLWCHIDGFHATA